MNTQLLRELSGREGKRPSFDLTGNHPYVIDILPADPPAAYSPVGARYATQEEKGHYRFPYYETAVKFEGVRFRNHLGLKL